MTRHVFTNDMVAHVWAQQSQDYGRSGNGNFYFRGDTIFSYRTSFPIARIAKVEGKPDVVLFTTRDYSITTSIHKTRVRHACSQFTVYKVLDPGESPALSLQRMAKSLPDMLAKALRGNVRNFAWRYREAFYAWQKARAFAGHFDLAFAIPRPCLTEDQRKNIKARVKAQKKRDATREQRERQAAANSIHYWRNDPRFHLSSKALRFATVDDHRARNALMDAHYAAARAAWIAGANNGYGGWYYGETSIVMRVRGDNVETSKGAEFPIEHAKRAFQCIANCRAYGRTYKRNGHSIHLGHFVIDAVDAEGNVTAGCHHVLWPEIERIARLLGLDVDTSIPSHA